MKITSNEYLQIENFTPYKIIDIYRNGKRIYTVKTEDTTATLTDLKRQYRRTAKLHEGERLKRLAVTDGENGFYSLAFCNYYRNTAEEFETLKRLKEQLEREHAGAIQVQTATETKTYFKQFKIVFVNWVA